MGTLLHKNPFILLFYFLIVSFQFHINYHSRHHLFTTPFKISLSVGYCAAVRLLFIPKDYLMFISHRKHHYHDILYIEEIVINSQKNHIIIDRSTFLLTLLCQICQSWPCNHQNPQNFSSSEKQASLKHLLIFFSVISNLQAL